ncbi:MAG: hypothetical protein ABI681_03905 [Gemmatimonadales bacterium]
MGHHVLPTDAQTLLRHTIATVAYRAGKVLRDAPADFADFRIGPATRTPVEILTHMGDLFDWALTMAQDRTEWRTSDPQPWSAEVARFFDSLGSLDRHLAQASPLHSATIQQMFQGPVADALTHTGQLALLRRLAGQPVRGESYAKADIEVGRTGIEQHAPRWEFD